MKEFQPKEPSWLDQLLDQPWLKAAGDQLETLIQSALDTFGRLLAKLSMPMAASMPENLVSLFSGFLSFLLILLGLYVFYVTLSYWLRRHEQRQNPVRPVERFLERSQLVNAAHHRNQASLLAVEGRYDLAVRQLYLAALCLLDETRTVPFQPTRTNREYVLALEGEAQAGAKSAFRSLAWVFEAARYGAQPITAEQYASCEEHVQALQGWARERGDG